MKCGQPAAVRYRLPCFKSILCWW